MSEKTTKKEEKSTPKHSNIFEALAAFQGEAPVIEKTKRFGKEGDNMSFMYASLDDVLEKALPITSKHGLSIFFEGEGGDLVCALYHTTYSKEKVGDTTTIREFDGSTETVTEPVFEEKNVKRTLPIKVMRSGDMKQIGNNSTYARRYMICEALGLAPDEDKDAALNQESSKNAKKFAFTKAKEGITKADTVEKLEKATKMLQDDLAKLNGGKAPALGLSRDEYEELLAMSEGKAADLMQE